MPHTFRFQGWYGSLLSTVTEAASQSIIVVFCRCSYVQIYKEQAYDLLNPTSIMMTAAGPQQAPQRSQQQGPHGSMPGALRMRWSKAEDFYLENLFKVECGSAAEALSLFRSGVQNKVRERDSGGKALFSLPPYQLGAILSTSRTPSTASAAHWGLGV